MSDLDRDSRQVLAFGKDGQEKIKKLKVGMVGLGGLGSQVAQQLAYIGVRNFVLVDPDKVSVENLNRIVGVGPRDLGLYKTVIAEQRIKHVASSEAVEIEVISNDLRKRRALQSLTSCDVVFGCIDKDGPRLILNELAISCRIPYIDSAFEIDTKGGRITQAGGRVVLVVPNGLCLLCCGEIDKKEARNDLASPSEREFAVRRGYIAGADVPAPSVISLDGVIASIASTEFLALFTGFRSPIQYSRYDMLSQILSPLQNKVRADCMHHLYQEGDWKDIFRYCI